MILPNLPMYVVDKSMVYLQDPCSRPKRTMPLLTGESGESDDATLKLDDDAHPCSPSLTHSSQLSPSHSLATQTIIT